MKEISHITMEALDAGPNGHLKPRLSKLTMVGMSFAILK
jgi:choline transport protein